VTENSDESSITWNRSWKKNYDAVETSSKNLKLSRKSSTRSTCDSILKGSVLFILEVDTRAFRCFFC